MPKKKKAGKALTGENKQLFIDIVQLCSADFRTKPQLVELANEIRLLLQGNTSTEIFEEKLQRDISLPEYKSNGKLNACLQNWMARWVEEGVMEANILRYAKDSVRAEASPIANIGGFVDVAGGVPRGATPGTAAVDSAPSSPAAAQAPPLAPPPPSSTTTNVDPPVVVGGGDVHDEQIDLLGQQLANNVTVGTPAPGTAGIVVNINVTVANTNNITNVTNNTTNNINITNTTNDAVDNLNNDSSTVDAMNNSEREEAGNA
jgi:hypothetical protein